MMWRRSLNKLIRQYLSFIEISKALNLDGSDKLKNKKKDSTYVIKNLPDNENIWTT